MSFIEYIEKLQQKPRHVRLQIMWVGSVLGAGVIFSFWLWSLTSLLAQAPQVDGVNDKALQSLNEIRQEAPGLWQSLTAGISEVINTAKEEINSSPSATPSASPDNQPGAERLPIE
jgi:hypothetical protein